MIKHRSSDASFQLVKRILACFGSKFVYLSAEEHDRITADTQAVTHAAFLRYTIPNTICNSKYHKVHFYPKLESAFADQ